MNDTPYSSKIVQLYSRRDTYRNPIPVWEGSRALALRKNLKKLYKDYFNWALEIYFELGLFTKALR